MYWVPLLLAILLFAASCTDKREGPEIHCFNQRPSVTLPSFTSTTCPTINQ